MTPYNIAFLFCRLLSIWCVARFVETFGQVAAQAMAHSMRINGGRDSLTQSIFFASWPLGLIVTACILWLGATLIAHSATANIEYSNSSGLDEKIVLRKLWNIGQLLLGLHFLIAGISVCVGNVIALFSLNMIRGFAVSQHKAGAVSAFFQVVLGAILVLLARRALKREANSTYSTSSQDVNQTGSL